MRARDLMTSPVITVRPEVGVHDAARLLLRHAIAAAPVVTAEGRLVGIVSEVDVLRGAVPADPLAHVIPPLDGPEPPRTVRDVMTTQVLALTEDVDVADVAEQLRQAGVRSIPIVRGADVVGIVSRRDLLRLLVRSDTAVRLDVLGALQDLAWNGALPDVAVDEGVVTISFGAEPVEAVTARAARVLAQGVPGAVRTHLAERR